VFACFYYLLILTHAPFLIVTEVIDKTCDGDDATTESTAFKENYPGAGVDAQPAKKRTNDALQLAPFGSRKRFDGISNNAPDAKNCQQFDDLPENLLPPILEFLGSRMKDLTESYSKVSMNVQQGLENLAKEKLDKIIDGHQLDDDMKRTFNESIRSTETAETEPFYFDSLLSNAMKTPLYKITDQGGVRNLALSKSGNRIAFYKYNNDEPLQSEIEVWDLTTKQRVGAPFQHSDPVEKLKLLFLENERLISCCAVEIHVWTEQEGVWRSTSVDIQGEGNEEVLDWVVHENEILFAVCGGNERIDSEQTACIIKSLDLGDMSTRNRTAGFFIEGVGTIAEECSNIRVVDNRWLIVCARGYRSPFDQTTHCNIAVVNLIANEQIASPDAPHKRLLARREPPYCWTMGFFDSPDTLLTTNYQQDRLYVLGVEGDGRLFIRESFPYSHHDTTGLISGLYSKQFVVTSPRPGVRPGLYEMFDFELRDVPTQKLVRTFPGFEMVVARSRNEVIVASEHSIGLVAYCLEEPRIYK